MGNRVVRVTVLIEDDGIRNLVTELSGDTDMGFRGIPGSYRT